ncbi:zf-CCHC domain-containing protein [Tanacetum coccineum]
MDSDKYLEGQSMQRPPLFESDHFIYWKNRFETYVKAKDLDLWHIILNGDFPPVAKNEVTQILEVVPFEEQSDDLKKKLAKNNEAKMVLYNALPKKEYERIFMCKMAKDIWQSLLITHQGNSQVKDNKMDLFVQQYEQFTILEKESIDSGFARFNTIISSLKALDEGFSSKTYVRNDDEESAMAVRNFKKFFRRKGKFVRQPREEKKSSRQRDEKKGKSDQKCFRCGDPNHLFGDCPKPSRNKDQRAFIRGSWSHSQNNADDKTNNETCLMAQSSNEKLERSKEIEITCKSCEELKLENAKLNETQVKFDNNANSLREMLNNQKSPSFKIGLGFDSGKASTSGTKTISFVGSSAEKTMDGSTIKVYGSTLPGSVSRTNGEKGAEHLFSPPMSSRSDFVITRKKLIHNSIDESKNHLYTGIKTGIGHSKNV